ncbi:transposable element Tcb1 transposase [Trichonephila clavipes]|nr:transposable element Tcb1 transposase [Trichonephila clavipes]
MIGLTRKGCLRTVTTLPWPSRSPDLSPIEHIWDHLGRRVGHPPSFNELEARLQQIWNEMSQDIIQNLYVSVLDRIESCIRARGGSTGDEAHFWLNGYVNQQNCRIWSDANPQVYVEAPLHPEKLTVWCALWAGGIIGPYFFKNDEGHNVTVNNDLYRATIDFLKDTFGDRLISRFGPVNWPPRSCDLTPLDYFLWGYVKS